MTANDHRHENTRALSRRTLLAASGAAALPFATSPFATADERMRNVGASDVSLQSPRTEPWTDFFGAVRMSPTWGDTRRDNKMENVVPALDTHDVIFALAGFGNGLAGTQTDFNDYMSEVIASDGDTPRNRALEKAREVIGIHRDTAHKVVAGQMGNEINSRDIRNRFKTWADANSMPYPHPDTPENDGPGAHDRGYIGYFAEYFLAPSIEGRLQANAEVGPVDRIPLMCGSIAGARHPFARRWLEVLLNYEFSGEFAPSLEGQPVRNYMDLISIHYILTADPLNDEPFNQWPAALQVYHDWIGMGAITGVWHTEEGGNAARDAGKLASVSQRVFARMIDWALRGDMSSDQIRACGFYIGGANAPAETNFPVGMNVLEEFLGSNAKLLNRSGGVGADVNGGEVETYGFQTQNGVRRVLFVTPVLMAQGEQGTTNVTAVTTQPGGWTAGAAMIDAQAHLFRTTENGHETLAVTVNRGADGAYTITLPRTVNLNDDNGGATLTILLTNNALA